VCIITQSSFTHVLVCVRRGTLSFEIQTRPFNYLFLLACCWAPSVMLVVVVSTRHEWNNGSRAGEVCKLMMPGRCFNMFVILPSDITLYQLITKTPVPDTWQSAQFIAPNALTIKLFLLRLSSYSVRYWYSVKFDEVKYVNFIGKRVLYVQHDYKFSW
jgi:hypothetical protein